MKTKITKRVLSLLMILLLLFLTACAGSPDATESGGGSLNTAPAGSNPGEETKDSRYGGVLNLTWDATADTLDPHYTTGWVSYIWSLNVFESLLSRDNAGNICPGVCNFELSEDKLTLKLWVRDGLTFHDGTPVEIEDVVASLERSASLISNVNKYFLSMVESCEIDGDTVTYRFTEFTPNTLYYVSGYQNFTSIMPKEICEKYGKDPILTVKDCIGTGPYYMADYEPNVRFTLNRYDGYVLSDPSHDGMAGPKMAYMDTINVWINNDPTSTTMALFNGEYDICMPDEEYAAMASEYGLVSSMDPIVNLTTLFFNTKGNRPVNDINLRMAIVYALDFEQLMKLEWGENYMMEACPMSQGNYYTDVFNNADYYGPTNLEKAAEYLAKSNYNGEELVCLVNNGYVTAIPVLAESMLEAAGIQIRLEYMDNVACTEYYSNNSNPYDMIFHTYAQMAYTPSTISSTPKNTFWGNAEKDALFAEIGNYGPGEAGGIEAWQKLAQLWVDDCAVVNLGTQSYEFVYNADLNPNWEGSTRFFYNAYWNNPQDHMN